MTKNDLDPSMVSLGDLETPMSVVQGKRLVSLHASIEG